jgi:FixJ family two-component response regulator
MAPHPERVSSLGRDATGASTSPSSIALAIASLDRAQLLSALETVAGGGSVVDTRVVEVLVAAQTRAERSSLAELTPREREVLTQVAEGKSNSAIADSLVLTKRAIPPASSPPEPRRSSARRTSSRPC